MTGISKFVPWSTTSSCATDEHQADTRWPRSSASKTCHATWRGTLEAAGSGTCWPRRLRVPSSRPGSLACPRTARTECAELGLAGAQSCEVDINVRKENGGKYVGNITYCLKPEWATCILFLPIYFIILCCIIFMLYRYSYGPAFPYAPTRFYPIIY